MMGAVVGAAVGLAAVAALGMWVQGRGSADSAGASTVPRATSSGTTTATTTRARTTTTGAHRAPVRDAVAAATPIAAAVSTPARPVVWIQAGHLAPGEPGYMAQTGAGGGPFGSEAAFNSRVRDEVVRRLRKAGVDARPIPARVPMDSRGAAFVSLHFDSPGGAAALGYAVTGRGENYYHGEGTGTASPTPYPDSAPHRTPATTVTPAVQTASKHLADSLARTFGAIYTSANGAAGRFTGVDSPNGNPRMMHFYGYYRTNARARVLLESGVAGSDDAFLSKVPLIGSAVAKGILNHLRSTGSPATPGTPSPAGAQAPAPSGGTAKPGASGGGMPSGGSSARGKRSSAAAHGVDVAPSSRHTATARPPAGAGATTSGSGSAARPSIVWKGIPFGSARRQQMADYSRTHYGAKWVDWRLTDPKVIVEHYTASNSFSSAWNTFASNSPDGELGQLPGTCAHFVVDTDGTIYQLVGLDTRCRHTVGLNHRSIGIEMVGTSDWAILRNSAQVTAALRLTKWLQGRFGIQTKNVIGHSESLSSPYRLELYGPWRNQTHGDWSRTAMNRFRARLAGVR